MTCDDNYTFKTAKDWGWGVDKKLISLFEDKYSKDRKQVSDYFTLTLKINRVK